MAKNNDQASLQQKVLDLEAEVLRLTEENDRLREAGVVNSVTIYPHGRSAPPAEMPTFSLEGKTYRFRAAAFHIDRQKRFAIPAVNDPVLLTQIVEKYPGLVEEI